MEVQLTLSLCPECTACPAVAIMQEAGRPVAVRLGEGNVQVVLPIAAWNTLVRYIREGVLTTL